MMRNINAKTNKRKKHVIIFIVIVLFLLFLSSFFAVSNRRFLLVEQGVKNVTSKVNKYFIDMLYDDKKHKDLVSNPKIDYLQKENNELRKMLDLKKENSKYVVAEVTNRVSKTFFNRLEISKGYDQNVKKDLPVINSLGLVGFTSKVAKNVSEVRLLTSVNDDYVLPVLIDDNGTFIAGVLSGYDVSKNAFKVTDVVAKTGDLAGKKVVLAGYDNELYKGIYVGAITNQEVSDFGLTKTVWVKSEVNFDDLLFVSVVSDK